MDDDRSGSAGSSTGSNTGNSSITGSSATGSSTTGSSTTSSTEESSTRHQRQLSRVNAVRSLSQQAFIPSTSEVVIRSRDNQPADRSPAHFCPVGRYHPPTDFHAAALKGTAAAEEMLLFDEQQQQQQRGAWRLSQSQYRGGPAHPLVSTSSNENNRDIAWDGATAGYRASSPPPLPPAAMLSRISGAATSPTTASPAFGGATQRRDLNAAPPRHTTPQLQTFSPPRPCLYNVGEAASLARTIGIRPASAPSFPFSSHVYAHNGDGDDDNARTVELTVVRAAYPQHALPRQPLMHPRTLHSSPFHTANDAAVPSPTEHTQTSQQQQQQQIQDVVEAVPGPAMLHGARVATAEERRVRFLYHNRPHVRLTERPLVVSSIVLDRDAWSQPLCYVPLFLPCLHNAHYSVLLSSVLRKSWEPDVLNPLSPSLAYSLFDRDDDDDSVAAATSPRRATTRSTAATPSETSRAPLSNTAMHYGPTAFPLHATPRGSGDEEGEGRARGAVAAPNLFQEMGAPMASASRAAGIFTAPRNVAPAAAPSTSSSLLQNCRHLLYRCFCVRCAVAAQAEALQTDMKMRGAMPFRFPCCSCFHVDSDTYSHLFRTICLLDILTLGLPCGCCCYQGLGTALYGWHLRFLVRARYRIFAWTAIDLLIMCCVPGLAVDQHGAELLLNGVPEMTVGLHFMS